MFFFVCFLVCVSIRLSVLHSSVFLYSCLSVCLPAWLSICLSVCLPAWLSVCLSVCLSVHPSVCPSVCLSIRLSVCLSVSMSVCLVVRPSVCMSVCLSVSACLFFFLPAYLTILSMDSMSIIRHHYALLMISDVSSHDGDLPLLYNLDISSSDSNIISHYPGSAISNGREPKSCLGRVFNFKLRLFDLLQNKCTTHTTTSRVENSAQV